MREPRTARAQGDNRTRFVVYLCLKTSGGLAFECPPQPLLPNGSMPSLPTGMTDAPIGYYTFAAKEASSRGDDRVAISHIVYYGGEVAGRGWFLRQCGETGACANHGGAPFMIRPRGGQPMPFNEGDIIIP